MRHPYYIYYFLEPICIFCHPCFGIVIIDLNIFGSFLDYFNKNKKSEDVFFNGFKIDFEYVEIFMKFLVLYSLIN